MLGLWCCVVSGWVGGEGKEDEEDEIILRVFARYTCCPLFPDEADW
jgi:serine/threonine-protein phosphatase 2A activator